MEINLPVKTIIEILGGGVEHLIDPAFVVKRISSLENAGPNDLAIILDRGDNNVFDPVSLEKISSSKAGIFLSSAVIESPKNYILVKDTVAAFQKISSFLEKSGLEHAGSEQSQAHAIHATAVVAPDAKIGAGTRIDAQVFIGSGCVIGANVRLYPGVKILDRCVLGDNVIIHAGTVIGSDGFGYQVSKTGLQKIPQIGIVKIGSNVEIGANCSIDRASFDETVIGDGVKMDNGIHIAHNVKIGNFTAILAQTGIAGSTTIGMGCQIGGQVAIKDNLVIGNGVKIVSKSAVLQDLKDGEIVAGIPAVAFGLWKRQAVALTKLPEVLKMAAQLKPILEKQSAKKWWHKFFIG